MLSEQVRTKKIKAKIKEIESVPMFAVVFIKDEIASFIFAICSG